MCDSCGYPSLDLRTRADINTTSLNMADEARRGTSIHGQEAQLCLSSMYTFRRRRQPAAVPEPAASLQLRSLQQLSLQGGFEAKVKPDGASTPSLTSASPREAAYARPGLLRTPAAPLCSYLVIDIPLLSLPAPALSSSLFASPRPAARGTINCNGIAKSGKPRDTAHYT